jgi:hypothetical protein
MKMALIFLALLLTSCATPVSAVKNTSKIHSVAVVAAVQDLLTMEYKGWLDVNKEDIAVDWELRKRLADSVTAALADTYEIKTLAEDPAPLLIDATRSIRGSNFIGPTDVVVEQVRKHVSPGQADAVLVVVDTSGALYHYQKGPGGDFPFYVGYFYIVFVFDGNTLALLGHQYGSIYRKRSLGLNEYDNPAIDVDIGWRGEPYASLALAKKEYLRRSVYELIDRSVPFTLKNQLHFAP